jgi:uncharacterized protein DUF2726
MSPDMIAMIVMLVVGAFIGVQFEKAMTRQRRAEWQKRNKSGWKKKGEAATGPWTLKPGAVPAKPVDPVDQLRTVMKAEFKAQPLLNKSEARLFKAMDKMVIELAPPGWQVMAQVSLGEILRCDDKEAYWCINAKRVDLLIVDEECRPLHAIEYQGGAHFKGAHATAARDAVKKEALRRAGIGYHEVPAGHMTHADLRALIEKLIGPSGGGGRGR